MPASSSLEKLKNVLCSDNPQLQLLGLQMAEGGLLTDEVRKIISKDPKKVLLCLEHNFLGILSSIQFLYLRWLYLEALPDSAGSLQKLIMLDMAYNNFSELPLILTRLGGLKKLRLPNNPIQHVPAAIGRMLGLEELDLRDNQLRNLPMELYQLPRLQKVFVQGNPLSEACKKKMLPLVGSGVLEW